MLKLLKKIMVLGVLYTVSIAVQAASTPYHSNLEGVIDFFGYDRNLPIILIRTTDYEEDIANAEDIIRGYGKSSMISRKGIDKQHLIKEFERRLTRTYEGGTLSNQKSMTFIQTYAASMTPGGVKPYCGIKVGKSFYNNVNSDAISIQNKITLAHEAVHCMFLSDIRKFKEMQAKYPGLVYESSYELAQLAKKNKVEAMVRSKYSEHVHEVVSDIGSLMYWRFVQNIDNEEFYEMVDSLLADRAKANYKIFPNAVGHYTYPYILEIMKRPESFDRYREQFLNDPYTAVLSFGYNKGKHYSFTYEAFERRFGKLRYSYKSF